MYTTQPSLNYLQYVDKWVEWRVECGVINLYDKFILYFWCLFCCANWPSALWATL